MSENQPDWPPPPTDLEKNKAAELLYGAQVDLVKEEGKADRAHSHAESEAELNARIATEKADHEARIAGEKADHDARIAREQEDADAAAALGKAQYDAWLSSIAELHKGFFEVAKASIDRARAGAETVQKAAAAIATVYTGVLALAFSVAERPLPARGLIPAVLLGWAIVWSTAYLAYLSKAEGVAKPKPTSDFAEGAMRRSITFIKWTRAGAFNRGYALRVSVIALAFGLVLLPAPFVALEGSNPAPSPATLEPDWPAPSTKTTDTELSKIVYQAQVNETADLRENASNPIADDGNDVWWWLVCVAALLLSLVIPLLIKWARDAAGDDTDEGEDQLPGALRSPMG